MKYLALGLIGSSPWIFLAVASYKADKISVPAILILIFLYDLNNECNCLYGIKDAPSLERPCDIDLNKLIIS